MITRPSKYQHEGPFRCVKPNCRIRKRRVRTYLSGKGLGGTVGQAEAGFRSLTEVIDTTLPGGRMMMQIVESFAEFERAMLRERAQHGLDAARKQGRVGGRRPKLKPHQQQEIVHLVNSGQKTAADAARLFNVHPATVSRLLKRGNVA